MNSKSKGVSGDPVVEEMMARFEDAYSAFYPNLERMERIQQSYDNQISAFNWPTVSNISFPLTFIGVEEQLPFAMKYLFPGNKRFITMTPVSRAMDADRVRILEDDMRYTMIYEMQSESMMLLSIKDCYKFAVGYGLIDIQVVTPPGVVVNQMYSPAGELVTETPQMVLGQRKKAIVYRYIPTSCVVPMPDGAEVDGPNKASGHFVLDLKYEDEFRDLYENSKNSEGKPMLLGNPNEIIAEARAMNFDSRMPAPDILFALSGLDLNKTNIAKPEMPVVVPILRCYFDHHHVWIANGKTKMHEIKDKFQTLSSDLVKWSAWPDGNRWCPLGITEASERVAIGTNVWYNGMVDFAMSFINPTRAWNSQMVDKSDMLRGPGADIKVRGDVNQAIQYLRGADFPQGLFEIGDVLTGMLGKANAHPGFMDKGNAGMVRGGTNALETLLGSSTGRQFLAAIVLKTGGLQASVEKTLIKKQLIIGQEGERFIEPAYDETTGRRFFQEQTVTREDLRNIFRVELNLGVQRLNSAATFTENAAYFDRAERHPELFDLRSLYEELTEDDGKVRRTMLPKKIVEQRQEQMAQAQMRAAAEPRQGRASAPMTQGDQALAGAAAIGGEM